MNLSEYRATIRTELSDTGTFFSDLELDRAVGKSVGLMSRLLPKRSMVEDVVTRKITGEVLSIFNGTGTLVNKPLDVGSLSIPNKTVGTDYKIDHLTGVVTGINLPDGDYIVSYNLDPQMFDISSFLPDYIKIERLEYPAGETPLSLPTFDILGDFVVLRGKDITFSDDKYLRLIHLSKWFLPTLSADGDYPSHLVDAIVVGSAGQSLIFKAEKYVQEAVALLGASNTTLGGITAHLTDADIALDAAITHAVGAITALEKINAVGMPCLTNANIALNASVTQQGASATALGKVDTYLAGATESAKALLSQIATDAASLRTAIQVALNTANAELGKVVAGGTGELALAGTNVGKAGTALDKISLYLETNETALGLNNANTRALLERITANAADLRTAIDTSLDAANVEFGKVVAASVGELALAGTSVGKAGTALDKIALYLETNLTGNARTLLEKITADGANLRTAVNTSLDAANAEFNKVVATSTGELALAELSVLKAGTALDKVPVYLETNTVIVGAVVHPANTSGLLENITVDGIRTDILNALTSANAELDKIVAATTGELALAEGHSEDAKTALAKVDTHLAGVSESVKALLGQIATDAISLRTAITTAVNASNTSLNNVSFTDVINHLAEADIALDKITTYLETNETALGLDNANAKALLERITTDTISLRTAINVSLDAANTEFGKVVAAGTGELALAGLSVLRAGTALDKVPLYLETNTVGIHPANAQGLLGDISVDGIRTDILSALTSANAELGKVVAVTTGELALAEGHSEDAKTALAKVDIYLAGISESVKALLGKIATDAISLRTAITTSVSASNTSLNSVSFTDVINHLAEADIALDKITTYLETNLTGNTKALLERITADAANLRTAINTSLDAANAEFGKVIAAGTGELALAEASVGKASTALDKVPLYLETNETALGLDNANAKALLEGITTDTLRTAILTALDAANTELGKIITATTGELALAEGHSGDAKTALAKVNTHLAGASESVKALLGKIATDAAKLRTAVATAITAAHTSLGGVSFTAAIAHLTDADTALDKVTTYLETNETALGLDNANAKAALEGVIADVANLRTAINTALDAAKTDLGNVKTLDITKAEAVWVDEVKHILTTVGIPGAEEYLEAGVGSINAVTAGDDVGEVYRRYAESALNMAKAWAQKRSDFLGGATVRTSAAMGLVQEAVQRLSHLRSYLDESGSWGNIAVGFVNESVQRINAATASLNQERTKVDQANGYLGEANTRLTNLRTYIEQATAYGQISGGFISEAVQRLNTATTLLSQADQRSKVSEGYVNESRQRLENLRSYVEEANGWGMIASGFISEGIQRLDEAGAYLTQTVRRVEVGNAYVGESRGRLDNLRSYIEEAVGWGSIAVGFVNEAVQRIDVATTSLDQERTKIDQANGYLGEANVRLDNLRSYIEQALAYGQISGGFISEASQRLNTATVLLSQANQRTGVSGGYITESQQRLENLRSYVEEANGWGIIASGFISEAVQRLGEAGAYLTQTVRRVEVGGAYITESGQRLDNLRSYIEEASSWRMLSDGFVNEAVQRIDVATAFLDQERTKIDQANGYLGEANARLDNLRLYIEQALAYGQISGGFISEASQRLSTATVLLSQAGQRTGVSGGYITESQQRLENLRSYIEEASGWGMVASGFIAEAVQRLGEAGGYLTQAARRVEVGGAYIAESGQRLDNLRSYIEEASSWRMLSDGFLGEAIQRLDEAGTFLTQAVRRVEVGTAYIEEAGQRLNSLRSYIEEADSWSRVATGFVTEAVQRLDAAEALLSQAGRRTEVSRGYSEEAGGRLDSLRSYLEQAVSYIGISNGFISEARERTSSASIYTQEAMGRLSIADRWIADATGRVGVSDRYINEAVQRITAVDRLLSKSTREESIASHYLQIAGRFLTSGQAKIQEFLITLGVKVEMSGQRSLPEQRA